MSNNKLCYCVEINEPLGGGNLLRTLKSDEGN